jgi:ectoine hydroxylase-related dioxygenase (phytanoyl-CoA dioxygenase family)
VVPEASDTAAICRYEFMCGFSPEFHAFVRDEVKPVVESLCHRKLAIFKDKTNEKAPGGGAFGPHQDHEAYKAFGAAYYVTAMISVDPANAENGCLEFAPDYRRHATRENVAEMIDGHPLFHCVAGGQHHGEVVAAVAKRLTWQPLSTEPCDLVVFDSFVPHRSEINMSARPRRAIFVTMNPLGQGDLYEGYYMDKRAHYNDPKFHVGTPTWRGGGK